MTFGISTYIFQTLYARGNNRKNNNKKVNKKDNHRFGSMEHYGVNENIESKNI